MAHVGAAQAADKDLLDLLLRKGSITQEEYNSLLSSETAVSNESAAPAVAVSSAPVSGPDEIDPRHTGKGFRLETADGNWRTDLQWRAQLRATSPMRSDPRQLSSFGSEDRTNFEARRLRMKIGGHGYQPWVKYYFEVDLQPGRDVDDSSSSASARVIDYRIDLAKYDWLGLRVGQWKIDLNRERVDSSGRQQFVERSIANRVFTMDRQMGVQLRGHLFQGTAADMRYWVGAFNGEGRSVNNASSDLMTMARLQWNFFGRDLSWRQTDVEYTDLPTGSLAVGGLQYEGPCTRWSSSGCGNLDGFTKAADADPDQFEIEQWVQEFAFKYRGLSIQQEYHEKTITDQADGTKSKLTGGYAQAGYFFHYLFSVVPKPLELAVRYAAVDEPNKMDRSLENERREYTVGANWFFAGHNNKLTLDYSKLTVDDGWEGMDESGDRVRLQWDVSF